MVQYLKLSLLGTQIYLVKISMKTSVLEVFLQFVFSLSLYGLVWLVPLAQVLLHPQLIFPSKTWFFGIYLNFQWHKSLKNQYLPHFESKSYQITSIKS